MKRQLFDLLPRPEHVVKRLRHLVLGSGLIGAGTLNTTPGAATASSVRAPFRQWITLKDISRWLYLHPVRWLAKRMPGIVRTDHPLFLALCQALTGRQQRRIQARLERVPPGLLPRAPREIARDYIGYAVRRIFDDLIMEELFRNEWVPDVTIRGREHLDRAVREKKGAMLISGHFFASRLAKRALAHGGCPVMSVRHYSPPDDGFGRLGGKYLQEEYIRFLHGVIVDEVYTHDPSCTMKVLQRLRQGGLVNIHIDAAFSSQLIQMRFLGVTRPFPLGFLRIAHLAGCPLIPFRFLGNSRHLEISFDEPFPVVNGNGHATLQAIVADLERQVLKNPEQWELWTRSRTERDRAGRVP